MQRRILFVLWSALIAAVSGVLAKETTRANGGARVALVIGNGAYPEAAIDGAVKSARAVADILRKGRFEVVYAENAKKADIAEAIRIFADTMEKGATAVVYYSGHALQYEGRNFLIAIDSSIRSQADIRAEAFDADLLLDPLIVRHSPASVIILDASRPNPWTRLLPNPASGLAAQDPVEGISVVYAANPGKIAARRQFLLGVDQSDEDTGSWFRRHHQSYTSSGFTGYRQTTGGLGILHAAQGSHHPCR